ncbi:MAG TPA: sulfatase-like hydrolase/transferase [Bacteroidales bacterium]|nr:sulfatase-like hydrolase/transferase [Bacteroidales bacterium]
MVRVVKSKGYYRGNYYSILIYRLLIALFFLWLSRIFLYFFNARYFGHLPVDELLRILFFGLRFDLFTLFTVNIVYIVMMTIPLPYRRLKTYRNIAGVFYYIPNILAIGLNMADVVYFRFTQKRMTGDIFDFLMKDVPFFSLLPQFVRDFWFYVLLFALLVFIMIVLARRVNFSKRRFTENITAFYFFQSVSFLFFLALTVIGIRGGLQFKPIKIISAASYTQPRLIPVVLNTPFTIIKTIDQKTVNKVAYFDQQFADSLFQPRYDYPDVPLSVRDSTFFGKNVVIIVMESLSSEHVGAFNQHLNNYQGFTPFLDSLMMHSLVFNGFANAKQSIEGIPAVVASLPGLMDRNFINSPFSGNQINSIAGLLHKKHYHTSFFHGGNNGTMDFDQFADLAGFRHYYGRNEYGNDADYDGKWGIYDEPFFRYFAKTLDNTPQPFFTLFFSLSAHHPYQIPIEYKGRFRKGNLQIQETIMYADYALGKFFEMASKMSWYKNTLFVITADHTSEAALPEYQTRYGMFRIPVVFFDPAEQLPHRSDITVSQVDIMPSVLALLRYDEPFIAFGQNIFDDSKETFAVAFINGIYQIVQQGYLLEFDGDKSISLYNVNEDQLLKKNLLTIEVSRAIKMENLLKAYIQQYYKRLVENRMTAS